MMSLSFSVYEHSRFQLHLIFISYFGVTIDSYAGVKSNDEKALMDSVAARPVSVGIFGSGRAFQLYSSVWRYTYSSVSCLKILPFWCRQYSLALVFIVGYGSQNGVDY